MSSSKQSAKGVKALQQQLQARQLELNALLEVTQAINQNLPADQLYRIYEFILRAQLGIDKLCLFIKEGETSTDWQAVCYYGIKEKQVVDINVPKQLAKIQQIQKTSRSRQQVLRRFDAVIPVYHKAKPLAYVLVGQTDKQPILTPEGLQFVQTLTNILAVAIVNKRLFRQQLEQEAMRKELELAAQMQEMLIPDHLPTQQKIELAANYVPHDSVGGDYYDVVQLDRQQLGICMADVSGKGIAAALLMANFQANLRAGFEQGSDLKYLIRQLNTRIRNVTQGEKFITVFLAVLDTSTRKLTYVNAGHNPPCLLRETQLTELSQGTTMIGMFDELPDLTTGSCLLQKEDLLFLYTDGLTETCNAKGEMYNTDRLYRFLQENNRKTSKQLVKQLQYTLDKFRGDTPVVDDITMLLLRMK